MSVFDILLVFAGGYFCHWAKCMMYGWKEFGKENKKRNK